MKLLILADDFTGALDTGVQFAAKGIHTQVVIVPTISFTELPQDLQVLVVDVETRHLTANQAYDFVYQTTQNALKAGFTHIYKKTDSALRGNVGSELAAVMDAAKAETLAFLPALPKMNRITCNGIHYINGVPVADSVFGKDPFEPVTESSIENLLAQNWKTKSVCHKMGMPAFMTMPGIHIYDAQTQEDLENWGRVLWQENGLKLCAGCAGFGAVIADLLFDKKAPQPMPRLGRNLFVVCGSVNPVTLRQMEEAEKAGFHRIHLSPVQKLEADWPEKEETIFRWLKLAASGRCILDVNDPSGCDDTKQYAARHGLTTEYMRQHISSNLAVLVKAMLDGGLIGTILCTGGDTLLALMKQVGVSQLIPVGEVVPGVVLTRFTYRGREYNIISKSGGFGDPDLFINLVQ